MLETFALSLNNLSKDEVKERLDKFLESQSEELKFKAAALSFENGLNIINSKAGFQYSISQDVVKNVISGNNTSRIEVRYKLIFTKKRQFLQHGVVRKCPGCGASISVNTKGVCEYCGALYNMSDYNYILSSITRIS